MIKNDYDQGKTKSVKALDHVIVVRRSAVVVSSFKSQDEGRKAEFLSCIQY